MERDAKNLHKRHGALMDDFWVLPEAGVELQWGTESVAKARSREIFRGAIPLSSQRA